MALIQAHSKMSDVITSTPDIIPVINRFGILLGTGDKTITEICASHNLDPEFLLCIINTYINEEYFPERALKSFCASTIISYLEKTYKSYQLFQLPNIERHFEFLIGRSGNNNNLGLMKRFFDELKTELMSRIHNDITTWFPCVRNMESGLSQENIDVDCSTNIIDKLNDLKHMFILHLSGEYEPNLCFGVIAAIISLEKDIRQNDRIRNRILLPLYKSLAQPN